MRRPALVLATLALGLLPLRVSGQDEIYELNDFVDPALLGTVLVIGDEPAALGNSWLNMRLTAGWLSDYQDGGRFTGSEQAVYRLSTSYYSGRNHYAVKVTFLDPTDVSPSLEPEERRLRLDFQYSRYYVTRGLELGDTDPTRWRVALGIEEFFGEPRYHLGFDNELIFESGDDLVHASISLLSRAGPNGENDEHYAFISYRGLGHAYGNAVRWRLQLLGAERSDHHWRWAPFQTEIAWEIPAGPSTIHLIAAPAYRVRSRGRRNGWNFEFGALVDLSLVSKLFSPPDPR